MKVVRHHHKFMQQILSLLAVVIQDINKQASHSIRLKNVSLLERRGGDEVATVSGGASTGSGHGVHLSGWKPLALCQLYRRAGGAAPPLAP